jgi:hypothetical protein
MTDITNPEIEEEGNRRDKWTILKDIYEIELVFEQSKKFQISKRNKKIKGTFLDLIKYGLSLIEAKDKLKKVKIASQHNNNIAIDKINSIENQINIFLVQIDGNINQILEENNKKPKEVKDG